MKIVHIANFYGPNSGGIKTTMHELGRGYLQNGIDYVYIVPGTQFREEPTRYGIKLTLPGLLLPGSGGYQLIRSKKLLLKQLERLQPDRIEISDRFTLHSVGRWAKSRGIPTVAFSHETLKGLAQKFISGSPLVNRLVHWHNRKFAANFDYIVATTHFASKEFLEIETPNLELVPLGVDLINFSPENRSESLRQELLKGSQFLIVHCARLSPEKDPKVSIAGLIELRKRGIDARLVIIGLGPLWAKLRAQAHGHPIDFLGYIADRKRVAAILSSADVMFAPGPLETFCLSALESLASGTPVVASNKSAVGEFLDLHNPHPAGAVAANTGEDFANKVIPLLGQSGNRIHAREVSESLPWELCVDRMLELHRWQVATSVAR